MRDINEIKAEIAACTKVRAEYQARLSALPRLRLGSRPEPSVFAERQALAGATTHLDEVIGSLVAEMSAQQVGDDVEA